MKSLILVICLLASFCACAQQPNDFLIVHADETLHQKYCYVFVNKKGDTVTRLDTAKYYHCFNDTVRHFAIVGLRHQKDWWAIDKNEHLLFRVFNTSTGEPSPDFVIDGMIRIVDARGKIGYADYQGNVVIKPQFEAASCFYKGKAIIGVECKEVLWCCKGKNEDKHYITDCGQTGYINRKGKIQKIGYITFEQLAKEIGWKGDED